MAGKRINLADLADEPVLQEARRPSFAGPAPAPRTARLDEVAPNPLNTRDIDARPETIASIADSMRLHGQLQPCTVVTKAAFLTAFPEHRETVGGVAYVQVTGARRRAAAAQAGMATLDVTVKDDLAESRACFIGATAAENIDREDLDPVEEARAVQLLVKECGSGKGAAEQLARTPAWVTQRLNLLKLVPELQTALRSGEIPLRDVRTMHQLPPAEQLAELESWRQRHQEPQLTAVNRDDGEEPDTETAPVRAPERKRLSPAASAVRKLGGTPVKIAESLRLELSPEDIQALIKFLVEDA